MTTDSDGGIFPDRLGSRSKVRPIAWSAPGYAAELRLRTSVISLTTRNRPCPPDVVECVTLNPEGDAVSSLDTQVLPLLPLTTGVVLPGMVVTLTIETDDARRAVVAAREGGSELLLVPRVESGYARVGTIAKIEESSVRALAKVVRINAPATGSTFGWLCSEVARLVIGRALGL